MKVIVFANSPEGEGSVSGRVLPKTLKMVLDTYLLNTQHYNVRIKGKLDQCREKNSAFPYAFRSSLRLGVVAIENGAFGSSSTTVSNFTFTTRKDIKFTPLYNAK